jgi:hypothetical protein
MVQCNFMLTKLYFPKLHELFLFSSSLSKIILGQFLTLKHVNLVNSVLH